MKKLARSKKIKIAERIKTAVILLLSLSCLFSGYYVFDIYRDQGGVGSFWWGSDSSVSFGEISSENVSSNMGNTLSQLLEPELIMVNRVGNRDMISSETSEFKETAELIAAVVKEMHSQPEEIFDDSNDSEWQSAIKSNSLYVRYPGIRSSYFEAGLYKTTASKMMEKIKEYEELIILPDSEAKWLTVYIHNRNDEKTVRARFDTGLSKQIYDRINNNHQPSAKEYAFAYELNLDKSDTEIGAETVLAPMFILPTAELRASNIIADVPRVYKTGFSFTKTTDFTTGLINIFGYNPNTVRQYVNSDDALIFVGETGSLSIHPDGYIEYKALGTSEGVSLVGQSQPEMYTITSGLVNMLDRVYLLSGVIPEHNDRTLKFTEITDLSGKTSKVRVGIDYFVGECKVKFSDLPAIVAVVDNGVLTELKMQVKTIKKTENITKLPAVFEAIDSFCQANPNIKKLKDGKQIYQFAKNGNEIPLEWEIQGVK